MDESLGYFHAIRVGHYAVYVSKRAKVGRVDLSGFTVRHPAVKGLSQDVLAKRKLGRVRAQLDFGRPDAAVVEAFRTALEMMKLLARADEQEAQVRPEGAKPFVRPHLSTMEKEALGAAHAAVIAAIGTSPSGKGKASQKQQS